MRKNILLPWNKELSYIIREIVETAKQIENKKTIYWENIWDPVAKWEKIPQWLKDIVKNANKKDEVYGYCPTRWLDKTLEYVMSKNPRLKKTDILFFNGLGDAINKIYKWLAFDSRIIWPNPAYPTHSSTEAAHAGSFHITYKLDPDNNWYPDLEELENKAKYNPNIVWILVINPDNPTWVVFPKHIMEKFVEIAKKYDLFLIVDEIYEKLTFDSNEHYCLSDIIWDVPGIAMKWISKDLPWPGARCGWIETYNTDKDENFANFCNSLLKFKMVEVCSTTLPQYVLPEIYESENYKNHVKQRIKKYKKRADLAEEILKDSKELKLIKPKWAFYLTVLFDGVDKQKDFKIQDNEIQNIIEAALSWKNRFDEKFCYFMLGETWVCTVPLSWFNSDYDGFRMTLLEEDEEKFIKILNLIKEFAKNFAK